MNKTNLSQESSNNNSDFIAGDVVVFIDSSKSNELMTVHQVQENGLLLDGNRNFTLSHLVRHASFAEIQANRRLTTAETALAEVS